MKRIIFILVLICCYTIRAQNKPISKSEILTMPLDSLSKLVNSPNFSRDTLNRPYFPIYLNRAKKERDTALVTDAYIFLIVLASDDHAAITYCDSLINYTKTYNSKEYPAFAHFMKSQFLSRLNLRKRALREALIAHKKTTNHNSTATKQIITNGIAIFAAKMGKHKMALTNYHKSLDFFKDYEPHIYDNQIFGLAESHLALKNIDSASYYTNLGLQSTNPIDLVHTYFIMTYGRIAYHKGNFITAHDSLKKSLSILKKGRSGPNSSINAHWLAKSQLKLGNTSGAIKNFLYVDSLFQSENILPIEVRSTWQELMQFYENNNDINNELRYSRKLIKVDSVLHKQLEYSSEQLTHEYLVPQIEKENKSINDQLYKLLKNLWKWIIGLASIMIVLIGISIFFRRQSLKRLKEYRKVTNRLKAKPISPIEIKNNPKLKPEVVQLITEKLKKFEKDEGFLHPSTSLTSIAKTLKTNPRYLSIYINHYMGQKFPDYLNTLRIKYVLNRLESSFVNRKDRFRIWSMNEIAKEAGFGSREYYSRAFFKYTNMKHRSYLKQLEKQQNIGRNS